MAATRLIPMHKIKNQSMSYTVHEWLDYAMNPDKTRGGELVTGKRKTHPRLADERTT